MKILSIDTSSSICSVCLLEDTTVIQHICLEDGKTHSEHLLPFIQTLLEQTHTALSEVDLLACSKGPGSFTGIRIGIATIKALAEFPPKPVIGISSLEEFAYTIQEDGLIASMLDARNNQVYFGLFKKEQGNVTQVGELKADDITVILEELAQTDANSPIFFVGDASKLHQKMIQSMFTKANFATDEQNKASSISVGLAAFAKAKNKQWNTSDTLVPLYLRKSSAERLLEERQKKENDNH